MLAITILVAAVVYQGVKLLRNFQQEAGRVIGDIGQPALWRGANFSQGRRFADFVSFLNEHIPEDGRVVLPPPTVKPKELGNTQTMQMYLLPRQVINCDSPQCAADLSRENTTILVVGEYPGQELAGERLMFDDEWGILLPPEPAQAGGELLHGFQSYEEILLAALWPFLWLCLLTAAGYFAVGWLAPGWSVVFKLAAGYGLGLSALTALLAVIGLAGARLEAALVAGVSGLLFLAALGLRLWGRRSRRSQPPEAYIEAWGFDLWQALFLALAALSLVLAVGQGYHATDEVMLWGPKGYGIAASGSVGAVVTWGTNTVAYPLHVPILIAGFHLLFGEILPASKIAFSGYYLALLLIVYHFLLHMKTRRLVAGLATTLIATAPFIFRHSTLAYANLPVTYYLVSGVFILTLSLKVSDEAEPLSFLSGLFFAAAAWTRPEALTISWLYLGLMLALALWQRWPSFTLRRAALLVAPLAAYSLLWLWLKVTAYAQPVAKTGLAGTAAEEVLQGKLHLGDVGYVLQAMVSSLFTPGSWGVMGVALLALLVIAVIPLRHLGETAPLFWAGSLLLALTLAMYYLTSYDNVHDISWWINTGLDRMLMPCIVLWLAWGVIRLELLDDGKNRAVAADLEQVG